MTGAGDRVAAEGRIAESAVAGRAVGALGRAALGHPRSVVVWTILLGTALRVLFAATGIDIAHSEAYYTATARHLALGYFDHPALSFWLTHAARALAGSDSLLVLRAPYILLFAGTTWIIYRITARAFGEAAGACAAVLLNLSPLFTVSMAGWVQPDGPMLFCLAAAAWCVLVIADLPSGDRRKAPPLWLAAGALFGLAALAKYYAVLMGLGVALFALTSARHRGWFAQPWPYLALAIALLFFAPTIIWNVHNGWISFAFQGERAFGEGFSVLSFLDTVVGQAAITGPWIWLPLVYAAWREVRRTPRSTAGWLFFCLALPPIGIFTIMGFWVPADGHFHWQAPGYLLLFPLLGEQVAQALSRGSRLVSAWFTASAVGLVVLAAAFAVQGTTGLVLRALPFRVSDPTRRAHIWSGLRDAFAARGLLDRPRLFVVAANRYEVGKIDLALGGRLPVMCLCADPRNIGFSWNPERFAGWDALIVTSEQAFDGPVAAVYAPYFRALEPAGTVPIVRGRDTLATLTLTLGHEYKNNYPLPFHAR